MRSALKQLVTFNPAPRRLLQETLKAFPDGVLTIAESTSVGGTVAGTDRSCGFRCSILFTARSVVVRQRRVQKYFTIGKGIMTLRLAFVDGTYERGLARLLWFSKHGDPRIGRLQ